VESLKGEQFSPELLIPSYGLENPYVEPWLRYKNFKALSFREEMKQTCQHDIRWLDFHT
jgi:hypothetical protein